MKPNFQTMNRKELKAYILSHRDDSEALTAYLQKAEAEGNWVKMPPMQSIEDLDRYPEFLDKIRPDTDEKTSV